MQLGIHGGPHTNSSHHSGMLTIDRRRSHPSPREDSFQPELCSTQSDTSSTSMSSTHNESVTTEFDPKTKTTIITIGDDTPVSKTPTTAMTITVTRGGHSTRKPVVRRANVLSPVVVNPVAQSEPVRENPGASSPSASDGNNINMVSSTTLSTDTETSEPPKGTKRTIEPEIGVENPIRVRPGRGRPPKRRNTGIAAPAVVPVRRIRRLISVK